MPCWVGQLAPKNGSVNHGKAEENSLIIGLVGQFSIPRIFCTLGGPGIAFSGFQVLVSCVIPQSSETGCGLKRDLLKYWS